MKEQLNLLWKLQSLEQEKKALAAKREKIKTDEVRRLWQEIRLMGQALAADREKLMCMQKVAGCHETDLAEVIGQLRQMEDHLYKGDITNIKEMEQVTMKCGSLRQEIVVREEEALQALEECERLANQIANIERELEKKKGIHAEKQRGITQSIGQVEECLKELDVQYHLTVEKIERKVYDDYTNLARKVVYPVARVENGVCSGCRRGIPARQTLMFAEQPIYCDNCGRILLMEPN
ncbi:MAG: Zn-ribbon protein, nucleic acid-binding [Firmicutes bacterium]|nr:Zn-ribbon protein, nucleic acid-binding [Bacillota bacterium]